MFCAICTNATTDETSTMEPLGKRGALVRICADCSTLDAGDDRAAEPKC